MPTVELHNNWPLTKLGDIAEFVNGGAWNQTEYVSSGVPVIRVSNIKNNTVILEDLKYLPFESLKKYQKHQLAGGDLVICTVGSHPNQPRSAVGRSAVIPDSATGTLLNQNAVRIFPNSKDLDQTWLGFWGRSDQVRQYILQNARGAANQVRMSIERLKNLEFLLPPLTTQHKTAAILSAYDDLIENNTRRIKILEEMAQAIYREWFVHFRFPGYENVPMVDSELGQIPEGWGVKRLGDVCSYLSRGISPKYDETSTSVVLNQRCIRDNKINFEPSRTHATKVSAKDKYLRFGDVLINSTGVGTLGRVAQVNENLDDCVVDSHVTIVRSTTEIASDYWGSMLINAQPYFEQLGMGATGQTELNRRDIASMPIVVPSQDVQEMFSLQGSPIRELAHASLRQNQNLRKTRDLLLPRLISGRLDLEELDIAV